MILINNEKELNLANGHRIFEEDFVCTINATDIDAIRYGNTVLYKNYGSDLNSVLGPDNTGSQWTHPGTLTINTGSDNTVGQQFLLQLGEQGNVSLQDIKEMTFIFRLLPPIPNDFTDYKVFAGWTQNVGSPSVVPNPTYDFGTYFNYTPSSTQLNGNEFPTTNFYSYHTYTIKRNDTFWEFYMDGALSSRYEAEHTWNLTQQGAVVIAGSTDSYNTPMIVVDYIGVKTRYFDIRSQ